jgi:hypothetical protein
MKRYVSGLLAIVIAVGALAFTFPGKLATANFRFNGDPELEADVENVTNKWVEFAGTITCTGDNQEACTVLNVPDQYYQNIGGVNKLNAATSGAELDFELVAAPFNSGGITTYHVSTIPLGSGSVDDKNR